MPCLALPSVPLPSLPSPFTLGVTIPVPSLDSVFCCNIHVALPVTVPPFPLALLLPDVSFIGAAVDAITAFIDSLPVKCPLD